MQRVGLVGWRGMVGSVLMDRMVAENDFAHLNRYFSARAMRAVLHRRLRSRMAFCTMVTTWTS